ncbi:alginate lyase-domain-containing protein [Mycena galopus ATCC 62051]|nr:alginate lyase-domain-containing protein [Mycena galopus ATCC 62051]
MLLFISRAVLATNPFVQYAVDFPDPNFLITERFGARFAGAEATIIAWAEEMASYGPWSVTDKPVLPPSDNRHDYMSWAPYWWADCSNVHNTTALSLAEESKECNFVRRDGQVNPERFVIQDFQSFFNLSDAVLYNSIAAVLQNQSSSVYSQNVAKFINGWFLENSTAMNPNLNYAQMMRGPTGQNGSFTGILDLRGFAKIASGILMLRSTKNSDWTPELDSQFVVWCKNYITWLDHAPTAKQAAAASNNHGTIFVNQYAALKLIVSDVPGAVNRTKGYFAGIFQNQINSTGDQPLEAVRATPYHYRNFNIAGMVTNARLLSYADPESAPWNITTKAGVTIQKSVDFVMTVNPAATTEQNVTAEIYPNVAAVASAYGDPDGQYTRFLNASGFAYADDATFLWDQPLAGGDTLGETNSTSASNSRNASNPTNASDPTNSSGSSGATGKYVAGGTSVGRMCFLVFPIMLLALEM